MPCRPTFPLVLPKSEERESVFRRIAQGRPQSQTLHPELSGYRTQAWGTFEAKPVAEDT